MKVQNPYMEVVDQPRLMSGSGAPRSTVYGALGRILEEDNRGTRTLGGLVQRACSSRLGPGTVHASRNVVNTEHGIVGHKATHVPGQHYGQVPYPGYYRSALGPPVS